MPPEEIEKPSTQSGFPPAEDAIIQKAVEQYRDMLTENWSQIRDMKDDSSKVRVGTSCVIDTSGKLAIVTTGISYARREKDEREDVVQDPNQTEMPLEDGGEG